MPAIREVYPYLIVSGTAAAIDFYRDVFEVEEILRIADQDGRRIGHAELRLGPVEDVDAHHARARAAGAEIVRPLADTSYGTRESGARDLDGHSWYFGTYLPADAGQTA